MPPEENLKTETPTSKPAQESSPASPLKQIRTFQGDVANALERQNESLFSIQQMAQLKKFSGGTVPETPSVDNSDRRRELFFLILGSIILVSLGSVGAWYGYQEYLDKTAPPTISAPLNRFIAAQQSVDVDTTGITRDSLLSKIREEGSDLNPDEVRHIVLRNGVGDIAPLMSTAEFLQTLKVQAPSSLVRSFDPLFMLGSVGGERFIIIKLDSFENSFAGMLSWEKTLAQDLAPVLTTSTALQNLEPNATFKDVISKNKDVRVLSTGTGTSTETVLLYSFFDNQLLILADNLATLQILIGRLTQALLVH